MKPKRLFKTQDKLFYIIFRRSRGTRDQVQFHFSRLIHLFFFFFLFTLPKYVVPEKSSRSNVASCVIYFMYLWNEYNEHYIHSQDLLLARSLWLCLSHYPYCSSFVFVRSVRRVQLACYHRDSFIISSQETTMTVRESFFFFLNKIYPQSETTRT